MNSPINSEQFLMGIRYFLSLKTCSIKSIFKGIYRVCYVTFNFDRCFTCKLVCRRSTMILHFFGKRHGGLECVKVQATLNESQLISFVCYCVLDLSRRIVWKTSKTLQFPLSGILYCLILIKVVITKKRKLSWKCITTTVRHYSQPSKF